MKYNTENNKLIITANVTGIFLHRMVLQCMIIMDFLYDFFMKKKKKQNIDTLLTFC